MTFTNSLWQQWVNASPFSRALITPLHTLNWRELDALVERYSAYLNTQGLSKGDILTIVGKNSSELVLAYLASINLGVLVAMTMPQPSKKLEQKLETLYSAGKERFVAFTGEYGEALNVDAKLIQLPSLEEVLGLQLHPLKQPLGETNDLASIVFTSGSTGNPKAVAHTAKQHIASATGLLEHFKFGSDDTWLLSLPMYHVSGLAIFYRWLLAGATLKVGTQGLEQDIDGCTHVSLVATQLRRLLDSECPLSLSHVLLGGSHISNQLAQEANQRGIKTWLGYGMTEAASTVTAKPVDESNTTGFVLPQRRVRVDDGRIYIAGETLASGYYYQGNLTPLVDDTGWFDSKDLGQWVDDQLLIIGRADNQFISGGENIHCEEIEQALSKLSGINQAIVVPVEDREFGFRPVAIVDCVELPTKDWFCEKLVGRLEKFKLPIEYYRMPVLDQQGIKVSRADLARWLKEARRQ
ncbi:o-succinylbenzoate--CoA ligase [Vibrio sp. THAF190c]|uniref:o-succinylbenzoate--CoA ligase n=1 Tax=Vibrio sp. THAF190c TaxID=2587865 RepID=UPI0012693C96|nr:o-succinylbenzoate--CoA ligase [Vibrio sp. THAF190c]QFT09230.1 2-succinylbenzoate--CoA ligase [Vibrio sp. THAF190c]